MIEINQIKKDSKIVRELNKQITNITFCLATLAGIVVLGGVFGSAALRNLDYKVENLEQLLNVQKKIILEIPYATNDVCHLASYQSQDWTTYEQCRRSIKTAQDADKCSEMKAQLDVEVSRKQWDCMEAIRHKLRQVNIEAFKSEF